MVESVHSQPSSHMLQPNLSSHQRNGSAPIAVLRRASDGPHARRVNRARREVFQSDSPGAGKDARFLPGGIRGAIAILHLVRPGIVHRLQLQLQLRGHRIVQAQNDRLRQRRSAVAGHHHVKT